MTLNFGGKLRRAEARRQGRSPGPTMIAVALMACVAQLAAQKFDLTKITSTTLYTAERGYGYEETQPGGPQYFSVHVPEEGNYKVTVTLGDPLLTSDTTIKAELRRLMLHKIVTRPGGYEKYSFIVNTRTTRISTGGEVKLKDREKTTEAWAWDDKLTLEFTGPHPAVRTVEIEKADSKMPTIYIAGDSTSTDQPREPFNSWGQMITRFFKPDVAIANNGESGESLKSFIGERRFDKVMSVIRPGDFLLIQMGHNDQKEKGEGVGAFTTYAADLKMFIAAARQHGATPILITPVSRLAWGTGAEANKIINNLGDYPEAVRKVGKEENVPVIDLNAMSKPFYEALGPANAPKAFADGDTTHHNNYGSYELAKGIVTAIKRANLPIAKYLFDIPAFDLAHPDPLDTFDVPAEPRVSGTAQIAKPVLYLIGDSTVRNGQGNGSNGQWGWGEPIVDYFDASKITVLNRALGGTSARTFLTQGLWAPVNEALLPGDFVIMQFGHNDGGAPDDPARARGDLPGIGEETKEIDNPITKQHEVVHTFGWYLRRFIADARVRGATPIVCSLIPRKEWTDEKIREVNTYAKWATEVAAAQNVLFVDLNEIVARRYDQLGAEKVETLFFGDHTHTDREGAEINADRVIAGLMTLPKNPLAVYLSAKGKAVKP